MSNTLLTPDMITKAALAILHNEIVVLKNVNRSYDDSFAKTGAKIGATLRIRRPLQFAIRSGATIDSNIANALTQTNTALTIAYQKGVDFQLSSSELALKIDEVANTILKPAMARISAELESDVLNSLTASVYNTSGTVGTALTKDTALPAFLGGKAKLDRFLAPMSDRYAIVNPNTNTSLLAANIPLFNPTDSISQSYKNGMFGQFANIKFGMSAMVPVKTNGDGIVADSTAQIATATGTVSAWTNTQVISVKGIGASKTLKAGDTFTIGGVYSVNLETKAVTSNLQEFVVVADKTATAGGAIADLEVSPALITTGVYQNVSNAGALNAYLSFNGAASAVGDQSFLWHKDAIAFVTADLDVPRGVQEAYRDTFDGISLRYVAQYSVTEDQFKSRFDILYGYTVLRPEHVVKVYG